MSTFGAILGVIALCTPLRASPSTHDAGVFELEWVQGRHADGGWLNTYVQSKICVEV
jgi:hypothetical protein